MMQKHAWRQVLVVHQVSILRSTEAVQVLISNKDSITRLKNQLATPLARHVLQKQIFAHLAFQPII